MIRLIEAGHGGIGNDSCFEDVAIPALLIYTWILHVLALCLLLLNMHPAVPLDNGLKLPSIA